MVLSPAQTQPPPVTEEEFANNIECLYKVDLPPDMVEKITLRHDKFMAIWLEENQKYIDKAMASWKKPNCETTIDMVPAEEPEKIEGKKKNQRVPAEEPEKIEGKKKNQRVGRKGKGKMSC